MKSIFKPIQPQKNNLWKYIIALLFFIVVFHSFFGAIAYNTFVILDHTLSASGTQPPILMWLIIGCFIGVVIGSVVACRKFKLNPKISLLVAIPTAIIMILLSANSGPLYSITPRTELHSKRDTSIIDSSAITTNNTVVAPKQKPQLKKKAKKELAVRNCIDQTTQISVTVKSDSVQLFFRIAKIKDGEWSDWETKFIPQAGQYALSGKRGKVFANSIQYYYEVKQEATRSQDNPFTKSLCYGNLNIITY